MCRLAMNSLAKFYMCRLAMNSLANTGASKVIRFISASGSTFKRCHKNARETRSHQVKAGVTWKGWKYSKV
jgi:hypothetical protein